MFATKIRVNINSQVLIKTAEIVSNSVLLAANAYLLGSGIHNNFREKRREKITNNLQFAAEIASAAAGLTKVVTETIGIHNAKGD